MRQAELSGRRAFVAPRHDPVATLAVLGHPRVDVPIGDVDVSGRVPGDVGGLAEQSINRRKRRIDVLPGLCFVIGGFLSAAKDHQHAARFAELDDHIRAFVDCPDIVVSIDPHAVSKGPCVKTLADFPDEFSLGTKLEQLCGGRRVSGSVRAVRARKHIDVPFGVHRDARHLAEIHLGWKLEELGDRFERNVWCSLLRQCRCGKQRRRDKSETGGLHRVSFRTGFK